MGLYLIFSICFLHLWFQLVQQNSYVFNELMGKVVRVVFWIGKIDSSSSVFFQ